MNIALIIAGGSGQRMHQDIPKQFITVYDKPVIIYTLEAFQRHPSIDAIEIVCLDGWHEILYTYCKQFGITKLVNIVSGGENGQSSIRNGVYDINDKYDDEDIILVHDAIRPMVSDEIISDCIRVSSMYGNAVSVIPCAEAMLSTRNGESSIGQVPRSNLRRTQTPQAFKVGKLIQMHKESVEKGITDSIASCTMFVELGEKIYFSLGSEKNVKLTTPDDIEIFKALLNAKKAEWMK